MAEPVEWSPDGTPRSPRFQDIYRSRSGGLAQARHVFLGGCGLPTAWADQPQWRILETGFGLGLNFLAAWRAWKDDPRRPRLLHFVSIEAWPVSADDIMRSAADSPDLEPLARELAAQWWGLVPGFHRLQFEGGRVLLTLCVGDAKPLLREQAFAADSVFLDGFDPQRNPALWELDTLKSVARCCRRGTRLATWTVAAPVRQDLQQCGFEVQKSAGLAPKRECLQARFDPRWTLRHPPPEPRSAVGTAFVVGSGLAGAGVAASLARRGWRVQVLDAGEAPAAGASALPAGMLAPHTSPDDNLLSRLSRAGVRITLQQAAMWLQPGDWQRTGVLEHRFHGGGLPELGAGQADWNQPRDAAAACVWHGAAAWIRPPALVGAWLAEPGVQWRGRARVDRVERDEGQWQALDAAGSVLARADIAVLAAALETTGLLPAPAAPADPAARAIRLHPVRGQVSWDLLDDGPALADHPHNGKGHFLPDVGLPEGRAWLSGSTYVRADRSRDERREEHLANLERLRLLVPAAAERLAPQFEAQRVRAWTGVRCASGDRRPLVGEIEPGLWICTALGSRGLTFAALCAELLAARLHGEPLPLPPRLAAALDLARPAASATRVPATP